MSKLENFLEKAGLLVSDDASNQVPREGAPKAKMPVYNAENLSQPAESATNVASVSGDIISEAYATLPKSGDNIYIVEELVKNFAMLPDEAKPQVVKNTLETMGKDISRFVMEANTKKNALANAIAKYSQKVSDEVACLDTEIAEAEKKISNCKQQQLDRKNDLEKQKQTVIQEVKRLENIINILGGK